MEQAKNAVREFLQRDTSSIDLDAIKPAVNNLLWMYLPAHINVSQAEALSCVIANMIMEPEKYLAETK